MFFKIVKFTISNYENENRDKKEVSTLKELGYNVYIICNDQISVCTEEDENIIRVPVYKTVYKQSRIVRYILILKNYYRFNRCIRNENPNCISCHDLIALVIGWISTWFKSKKRKPLLVYDAHEYEIGRNTDGKRGSLARWIIPKTEKFLMKKCAFSMMVNDSIAEAVQQNYHLKEKPVVVRNIPNYWEIDEVVCQKKKEDFCKQLNCPNETFIMMYHGGLLKGRGIEKMFEVIQRIPEVAGVILGSGEEGYLNGLKKKTVELDIEKRIFFHPAVPIEELWKYVGAADVGMVTVPAICESYYYMLPNKFFENIQALTPIIASDFPETGKLIREYDIGFCVDPEDTEQIVEAVETLRENPEVYKTKKANLKVAKEVLCWEREKQVLINAYEKIEKFRY